MRPAGTVLYVDDVEANRLAFRLLEDEFRVLLAPTPGAGLKALRGGTVDVVLSDKNMPEMSGVDFLKQVAVEFPQVIRCMVSVSRDLESLAAAVNSAHVFHYFTKPWDLGEVRSVLREACHASHVRRATDDLSRSSQVRETNRTSSEEWFRTLFECSHDAILVLRSEGIIEMANPALLPILGYQPSEVVGRAIEFLLPDSLPVNLFSLSLQSEMEGTQRVASAFARHAAGHEVPLAVTMNAMRQKAGVRFIVSMRDLTFQREAEARAEASERARERAERANRAKDAFLAGMSHEIRTPLNAVLGFAQLLRRDSALPAGAVRHAEGIENSGRHLLRLINDVLQMSKIESGQVEVRNNAFNPEEVLEDVIQMFEAQASEKGIVLRYDVAPGTPARVLADGLKLRQILINVIGNAVKFTDVGRVAVLVRAGAIQGDTCFLNVQVTDTGPGVEQSEQEYVFEKFSQTAAGLKRSGTGLGLSISREYARLMGGDLKIDSVVGQGSCFQLTIPVTWIDYARPLTRPPASGVPIRLSPQSGAVRALIVDDVSNNRQILAELLSSVGIACKDVESAREALDCFESYEPHLVLTDLRMPEMDGWELIEKIRTEPRGRDVTIIAVSASAFEESRDAALAAGADAFVAKPFLDTDVFAAIAKREGVHFEYEGSSTHSFVPLKSSAGRRAIERLSSVLLSDLISAAQGGDLDALVELSESIESDDLRDMILSRAKRYDYEGLLTMLQTGPEGR